MDLFIAAIIGLIAGLHASTWGMYKDAVHEGFSWAKYIRSPLIGLAVGIVLQSIFGPDLSAAGGMVVFFGLVYAVERLAVELWKSFVRVEDQSKYFIPMRFAVRGKPVMDNRVRWSIGIGVLAALALFVWGTIRFQRAYPALPPWLVLVTIGSLGGWLTAFGGAWKDAPVEGFETLKFFRSPVISLLWAILLAFFTESWLFIAVAGAGYSVATIETYKKFFFPTKAPGKFAGTPMHFPEMLRRRRYFAPVYVAIWVAIVVTFVVALRSENRGLV